MGLTIQSRLVQLKISGARGPAGFNGVGVPVSPFMTPVVAAQDAPTALQGLGFISGVLGGAKASLADAVMAALASGTLTVGVYGDSTAEGYAPGGTGAAVNSGQPTSSPLTVNGTTIQTRWPDILQTALGEIYQGIVPTVVVHNFGYSGDTTRMVQQRWNEGGVPGWTGANPATATLAAAAAGTMISLFFGGYNDAFQHYGSTISEVRTYFARWIVSERGKGGVPVLVLQPSIQSGSDNFKNLAVREALKSVAILFDVPVYDADPIVNWLRYRWIDGTHFVQQCNIELGHHLAAALFHDTLSPFTASPGSQITPGMNVISGGAPNLVLDARARGDGFWLDFAQNYPWHLSVYCPEDVWPVFVFFNPQATMQNMAITYADGLTGQPTIYASHPGTGNPRIRVTGPLLRKGYRKIDGSLTQQSPGDLYLEAIEFVSRDALATRPHVGSRRASFAGAASPSVGVHETWFSVGRARGDYLNASHTIDFYGTLPGDAACGVLLESDLDEAGTDGSSNALLVYRSGADLWALFRTYTPAGGVVNTPTKIASPFPAAGDWTGSLLVSNDGSGNVSAYVNGAAQGSPVANCPFSTGWAGVFCEASASQLRAASVELTD